jgi:hypothetical protein
MDNTGSQSMSNYVRYYNAAKDPAYNVQSNSKVAQYYGIYAYGDEADYLDDLVYYAYNESDNPNIGGGTDNTVKNYFPASDTAALKEAMNTIFNTVIEYLGVTDVVINDGTTNKVTTTTGVASLLEVDEESYEYWLTIPVSAGANNTYIFQRPDAATGELVDYTVTSVGDGQYTITRGSLSVTVKGTIEGSGNLRNFKYKWEENNGFDKNPPDAHLDSTTGTVVWDLDELDTLLSGVTYSVTFDVQNITVLFSGITFPTEFINCPSSSIRIKRSKQLGCAFSISSKSSTQCGFSSTKSQNAFLSP